MRETLSMSSNERILHVERVRRPAVESPTSFDMYKSEWKGLVRRAALIALFSAACLAFAALGPAPHQTLAIVLTLLFAGVCCVIVMGAVMNKRVVWTGLRMRARSPLQITGSGFGGLAPVLAGVCFLSAAGCILWSWFTPGANPVTGPISPAGGLIMLMTIGLGCVIGGIVKHFLPSGIEIDETGVGVRKGMIARPINWTDLYSVSVSSSGKILSLLITRADRSSMIVPAIYIGSNPYFVAELIAFYDSNPGQRHLLAAPFAAVENALMLMETSDAK